MTGEALTGEALTQVCPACGGDAPLTDKFCEVCGASLDGQTEAGSLPCPKCGAGAGQIDSEGFCSVCGIRREERGRDHLELAASPALAGVTDRGLRHHRNEDFLVLQALEEHRAFVLVVCDGVSSVRDPDVASEQAALAARDCLAAILESGGTVAEAQMETALEDARRAVAAIPFAGGPDTERPATTIVAAVSQGNTILVAWLGDSRAYWIDAAGARPLTSDHSWLNDVVSSGAMTAAAARSSGNAHAITRWLGADADPGIGDDAAAFQPGLARFEAPGPGLLLLCTDGLWNYAPEPEAVAGLAASLGAEPINLARGLVEFARSKGGNDNITAAVLSLVPDSAPIAPLDALS